MRTLYRVSIILTLSSFFGLNAGQVLPKFMGRDVTVIEPDPRGAATICLEGLPRRQCYTAPEGYGNDAIVTVVQVQKNMPALFFSASSGGVSGSTIHFALLRPDEGQTLQNLFASDMSVSNQSEHAFWIDSAISDAQIFLTAEYTVGPDESHYGAHRYMISAYVRKPSSVVDGLYYLEDRYMTARKYDLEKHADILISEKQEILARLRRLNAKSPPAAQFFCP